MLLQAHDYRWLHGNRGVELQIGGSDQWGNILSGVDLIRRARSTAVHALCWPLLLAPDGTKLGKTTGARTWLSAERTSPYRFFQHWMQTDDRQVREFLAKFTLLPLPDVDELVAAHEKAPERREAQRALAREVTGLVHGPAAAGAAEEASRVLFGGDPGDLSEAAYEQLALEVPTAELVDGTDVVTALLAVGLASSRSDARRNLEAGAVYVNGLRVGPEHFFGPSDLRHGRFVLLRKGKRSYALLASEVFQARQTRSDLGFQKNFQKPDASG
jgi:tyrosyl-tRNA synthetase